MINDPISRLALFNNTGLSKADDTAKADDISAFNQLLKSSKDDSSSSSRSFGAGNGYDNSSQNNIDSKSLLKAARAAADKMVDADAAAIAQRVENHKDSVRAESAASAVKKVTEVFKEIKF
ncbi:hypothetical protein OA92_21275 [Marinomonas sp. SBI22]|uniref:hypothetical protein n=1 Tax=unclassified Marinomonas TaxID=196814 RepID=UPI0007AFCEE7|nr:MULTISPECIES: hypothetical protein [unclassified Marinomonas]KZM39128.1 hypothetical protein OA92_21275 [Marinomonas sp. SBI22]KZM39912.1 hypothetical protein OA91_21130 [Marinomonas sp. SBI8L]